MLMTPEEAATVWCPFSQAVQLDTSGTGSKPIAGAPHAFNRMMATPRPVDTIPPGCQCLGPRCALWEWTSEFRDLGGCGLARVHPVHQIALTRRVEEST